MNVCRVLNLCRNDAILSRIAKIVGGGLIGVLFYSPAAFAEPKILEVQPWPTDAPTQLIIWGTDFGPVDDVLGTPMIHFGTESTALGIAADQSLCPTPPGGPAPPLELGFDCVVANLPLAPNGEPSVPAGDYLLQIWVETEEAACVEKPSSLTFEFDPADCFGSNAQDAHCEMSLAGFVGPTASLTATGHNNAAWDVDSSPVAADGSVTFTSAESNGKWPNTLGLLIEDDGSDLYQYLEIHTSCSQPLVIGDVFGSMVLTDMNADALGPFTQHDLYDLTLGATGPEGPQGPQGKLGPQGPQGKDGAQGPQGKLGDQGPQGKDGAQGPQGKDGAQGPQGKLGPQGPQGKKGDPGDPGGGVETNLMCFGTDQTIGTQGKYMGLGQQAGEHDTVGVISPFSAGAQVLRLVVKVAQGNSPRDGTARLFHDDPLGLTDLGEQLSPDCNLVAAPSRSTCEVDFTGSLTFLDSLSVFVFTAGGSFEGASACVLIDPDPGT